MSTPTSGQNTTGSGSAGTDPQLAAQQQEANRFALDIVTNRPLMQAYFTELSKAVKSFNGDYEGQIMSNFLEQKGYKTNFNLVVKAMSSMPMYKLYYWSGTYRTTVSDQNGGNKQAGGVLAVQTYNNSPVPQVSFGESDLINTQYNNLVLSWGTENGFNPNAGNLVFQLTKAKGSPVRSFTGSLTGSDGSSQLIAGYAVPTAKLTNQEKQTVTDNQSLARLDLAAKIVGMIAQVTFIGLNLAMLYKTQKELSQLKKELADNPENEDLKKQEADAESDVSDLESDAGSSVDGASDVSSEYDGMSDSDFSDGSESIAPDDSDFPDLSDMPSDDEFSSDTDSLLSDSLSEEGYESTEYDSEGEGSGSDADDEGDFDNVFEDADELPMEL